MALESSSVALAELEERLAADVRPVRPFYPDRVGLLVIAIGFGLGLSGLWSWLGLRSDAALLGPFWLWAPSLLSIATGGVLISLALRWVIPGNRPPVHVLAVATAVGLALCAALYYVVDSRSSTTVPSGEAWQIGMICVAMEACLGLPALLLLLALARRGVAANPWPAALAGAFGVSLVSDAVWRMICPYSDLEHVVLAHGPGMVVLVLLGVAAIYLWDRWQLNRRS